MAPKNETPSIKPIEFKFLRETLNTLVFSEVLPDGTQFDPKAKAVKGERQHVVGTLYVDKTAGFTPDSVISMLLSDIA